PAPLQLSLFPPEKEAGWSGGSSFRVVFLPSGQYARLEPHVWAQRLLPIPECHTQGCREGCRSGYAQCHYAQWRRVFSCCTEVIWSTPPPRDAQLCSAGHNPCARFSEQGHSDAQVVQKIERKGYARLSKAE